MLHNTGPYGPNEAPINMGTPVNMTPMSGHVNLPHNINNLSKMAHQGIPASSGHYNLPDYTHYNHPSLGMPPQMPQFPNYQQLGFPHSYTNQNANFGNDLPFPNGMFPMNLNIQNEHNASAMNYAYDKRMVESMRPENDKEQNLRKTPLNIPQIPNKSFTKHVNANNDYLHNNVYENSHNLDLSMKTREKIQIDSTRRKNIENTVKLIENILINSSNKPRVPPSAPITPKTIKTKPTSASNKKVVTPPKNLPGNNTNDPLGLSPAAVTNDNSKSDNEKNVTDDKTVTSETDNDSSEDDDDIQPIAITQHFIQEEEVEKPDENVVVKVEKASWADTECFMPFLKDPNGFQKDDVVMSNYRIIESEYSVAEATAAYKNDIKPEGVFECPHCTLLFKHPKRFLIHTHWHTFGLTNVKRTEIAKEREQKRSERREARILERMKSKEVADVKEDDKVFPCKDCDKVFSTKGSLKNHRQRIHPTGIRECKICHKSISTWTELRAHLATHSAESGLGYQCSKCPKRFKYSHSLAKHADTHLEKVHACTGCPKKFGSQALVKMHMKTHERMLRGATYRCTYCGKGFFESYSLQVHERTHRNERPFVCDICNTSFGTNSSLKRHVKVSHSTEKPYQCSVCRRNFSTESIRDRHELRLHGAPEDFKFPCKQCSCKYLKLKDLQKHVYKMHPKSKRKKKDKSDSE